MRLDTVWTILKHAGVQFASKPAGALAAWGSLLTHFAAGVFMQVLRPFKAGDPQRAGRAGAGGRHPVLLAGRPAARGAALRVERALLAGVF